MVAKHSWESGIAEAAILATHSRYDACTGALAMGFRLLQLLYSVQKFLHP